MTGGGRSVPVEAILPTAAELGDGYVGHVPFDDSAVALLCRGASLSHRTLRRSSFAWAVRSISESVMDPLRVRVVG